MGLELRVYINFSHEKRAKLGYSLRNLNKEIIVFEWEGFLGLGRGSFEKTTRIFPVEFS